MKTEKVKVGRLILDWKLWPRCKANDNVDSTHVSRMKDFLIIGGRLPFIIVDRKSMRIIDGFHRYHAYMSLFGDDFEIEVELRDYKNDSDMFLDSVSLNSKHGIPLTSKDRAHVIIKSLDFNISKQMISMVLGINNDKIEKYLETRTAKTKSGETIALPGSAEPLAGTVLTDKQVECVKTGPGPAYGFYIRTIINGLASKTIVIDDKNTELLKKLKNEINKTLKGD